MRPHVLPFDCIRLSATLALSSAGCFARWQEPQQSSHAPLSCPSLNHLQNCWLSALQTALACVTKFIGEGTSFLVPLTYLPHIFIEITRSDKISKEKSIHGCTAHGPSYYLY